MQQVLAAAGHRVDREAEPLGRRRHQPAADLPADLPEAGDRRREDRRVLDAGDVGRGHQQPGVGLGPVVVLDDDEAARGLDERAAAAAPGRRGRRASAAAARPNADRRSGGSAQAASAASATAARRGLTAPGPAEAADHAVVLARAGDAPLGPPARPARRSRSARGRCRAGRRARRPGRARRAGSGGTGRPSREQHLDRPRPAVAPEVVAGRRHLRRRRRARAGPPRGSAGPPATGVKRARPVKRPWRPPRTSSMSRSISQSPAKASSRMRPRLWRRAAQSIRPPAPLKPSGGRR